MTGPYLAAEALVAFAIAAIGFIGHACVSFALALRRRRAMRNVLPGHHAEGIYR